MARAIRWQIQFKSLDESVVIANIYDDGWTGSITQIKGAAQPTVIDENKSTDMLEPLRSSTGFLNIVAESDMRNIFPTDTLDRYVELKVGSDILWQGYLQIGSNSQPWDVTPYNLQLSVRSCVDALNDVEIVDDDFNLHTLGYLIKEALTKSGGTFSGIWIPQEWKDTNGSHSDVLKLRLQKYTFFDVSNTASDSPEYRLYTAQTYGEMLTGIVKLFGWTIHEKGTEVFFKSPTSCNYSFVAFNQLDANLTISNSKSISAASLGTVASADNVISIIPSCRSIEVTSTSKVIDIDSALTTDTDGVEPIYDRAEFISQPQTNKYVVGYQYNPNPLIAQYKLNSWYIDTEGVEDLSIGEFGAPVNLEELYNWQDKQVKHLSAILVKNDVFDNPPPTTKKNFDFEDRIYIAGNFEYDNDNSKYLVPTNEELKECPVISYKSKESIVILEDTCVNISYSTTGGYLTSKLIMRIKVGNKYWNGSHWTDTETWVNWNTVDQKTLWMPYNGQKGYFCHDTSLTDAFSGFLEIDFALRDLNDPFVNTMSELKVKLLLPDNPVTERREDAHYYKKTGKNGNVTNIELDVITNNNQKNGWNALIYGRKSSLGSQLLYNGVNKRPEVALADKAATVYGKAREVIEVTVSGLTASPLERMTIGSKSYSVLSISLDIRNNRQRLTLIEL